MNRTQRTKRPARRGATLVIVAMLALGLAAATGLAADAGMMYYQRTRMQVAADAAALAGARGLERSQAQAVSDARTYSADNGYALASSGVSFPHAASISVVVHGPAPLLLSRLLGIATPDIAAAANADLEPVGLTGGVRPFGIPDRNFIQGYEYQLKEGAGSSTRGNFQALAIDGPGAAIYEKSIVDGASTAVSSGQNVDTEPGDIVGPTDSGVAQLVGGDQTPFEQAVASPYSTPRVVTVCLLDPLQWADVHGRSSITVTGFARFYVIDAQSGVVDARFIDRLSAATVAGTAAQYAAKLVP